MLSIAHTRQPQKYASLYWQDCGCFRTSNPLLTNCEFEIVATFQSNIGIPTLNGVVVLCIPCYEWINNSQILLICLSLESQIKQDNSLIPALSLISGNLSREIVVPFVSFNKLCRIFLDEQICCKNYIFVNENTICTTKFSCLRIAS